MTLRHFEPRDRVCTVITDASKMAALENDWNNLWFKAKGSVFQTYSLTLHSWNEVARPNGHSLFCVVVYEAGQMSLVFPLVRYRRGPFWIVRPLSPNSVKITDVLVDPDSDVRQNIRLAWSTIEKSSQACIIDMPHVVVGSALELQIQSKRHIGRDANIAPFADFHNQTDWSQFIEKSGINSKQQLNRKRKKLAEMGRFEVVEIDPVADPTYAAQLLDWMFGQKRLWGERVGKNGNWLTSDAYRRFLIGWATDPASTAKTKIYAILIDNQPIAANVASFCLSHVDGIIAGFHADPKYAKYSPGLVLDEFIMRGAFDKRLNVEFGIGSEAFKLQWSRNAKTDIMSYYIPQNLSGAAIAKWWHIKQQIDSHREERAGRRRAQQTKR
ncbi:GNAT family N-acetyltransferase [Rhizobium sp. S152]|uniref:GNAT family N-acetyltransferase n=1 Tax=Rhizobium sp. S152 TaxID=3055038 RepID=UPI0025AA0AD9|nr:GNAT family N-acetyltransferase [Rhizobium sp. S152]MDM9629310.1 GNAT family N-acetyltransferase [Rhizobium sp. S152]